MPIEIREVIIKAEITNPSAENNASPLSASDMITPELIQTIRKLCKQELNRKERKAVHPTASAKYAR